MVQVLSLARKQGQTEVLRTVAGQGDHSPTYTGEPAHALVKLPADSILTTDGNRLGHMLAKTAAGGEGGVAAPIGAVPELFPSPEHSKAAGGER